MTKLRENHIAYTRNYIIISAFAGLTDTDAVAKRLLKNQDDIADAITPQYGEDAGKKLSQHLSRWQDPTRLGTRTRTLQQDVETAFSNIGSSASDSVQRLIGAQIHCATALPVDGSFEHVRIDVEV